MADGRPFSVKKIHTEKRKNDRDQPKKTFGWSRSRHQPSASAQPH
jgi:hypothetical protein